MDTKWAKNKLIDYVDSYNETDRSQSWDSDSLMPQLPTVIQILKAIGEKVPTLAYYSHMEFRELKDAVLRGQGILTDWEEVRIRLQPDAPSMIADQFHYWAWEAARPSWESRLFRAAVHHAASAINEQLQRKVWCQELSDDELIQEAFSAKPPVSGRARLRVQGNAENKTTASRQRGALQLGLACFWIIRNPAAHETSEWNEQYALECLATLSLLARTIDDCTIERYAN